MAGETVWIIEDEEPIRELLERAFSATGHNARSFPTGTQALEALAAGERPDAVLCDCIGAPCGEWKGMHVDEFYTQAGQYLGNANRYAMSGWQPEKLEEHFGDLSRFGVIELFLKPFIPTDVIKRVQKGFAERTGQDSAEQPPYDPGKTAD
jgi:DNA-binding NtrC family response regulator